MRTKEQVAADEKLRDAIEEAGIAYGHEPSGGIMLGYIVMSKRRYFDEDGDALTAVDRLVSDPAPSLDEQMGMHEYDLVRLRKIVHELDD